MTPVDVTRKRADDAAVRGRAWGVAALEATRQARRAHQARFATQRQDWIDANRYYYESVTRLLRFIVEPGSRVLSIASQTGFFLGALQPAEGVGIDLTEEMAAVARSRHPQFVFLAADPEQLDLGKRFDYILVDQVSNAVDVLALFRAARRHCGRDTRMVVYTYNHLWESLAALAEGIGLKMPQLDQNWLAEADLRNLLALADFEWLQTYRAVLVPKRIPIVSEFVNRVLAKLPGLRRLCLVNVFVARPAPEPVDPSTLTVSVIVPCKNERGNIESAVNRIPDMGAHTEILFCDDKSTDGTADEIRRMQRTAPDRDIRLIQGPGVSKAKNVWTGFDAATGDVLMILDGDLAVMPEELPYFLDAIASGRAEFVNGSRMVYPMQKMAMKASNMIGNKFFSLVFSYLLDQPVKDTLCGTKVLRREHWARIRRLVGTWGVEDRWGDYELLFGAARHHLRIMDLPVHYQERIYGTTKMVRVFHNGLIMLRMCAAGFRRLKVSV